MSTVRQKHSYINSGLVYSEASELLEEYPEEAAQQGIRTEAAHETTEQLVAVFIDGVPVVSRITAGQSNRKQSQSSLTT